MALLRRMYEDLTKILMSKVVFITIVIRNKEFHMVRYKRNRFSGSRRIVPPVLTLIPEGTLQNGIAVIE